jgi:hypothetical protein
VFKMSHLRERQFLACMHRAKFFFKSEFTLIIPLAWNLVIMLPNAGVRTQALPTLRGLRLSPRHLKWCAGSRSSQSMCCKVAIRSEG